MKKIMIIGATALFALNCGSSVNIKMANDRMGNLKKIALLETILEKPSTPSFPLIQAGIFNSKFNGIAPEIDKVGVTVIDQYRENVAKKLASELGATVVSGNALVQSKDYAAILKEGLQDFPVANYKKDFSVIQASGEKNFFNAADGEFANFFESGDFSKHAVYFCQKLKVDAIAFSTSKVVVQGVDGFANGMAVITTHIAIYDSTGTKVLTGTASLDPVLQVNSGGDIGSFTMLMQPTTQARPLDAIFAKVKLQLAGK